MRVFYWDFLENWDVLKQYLDDGHIVVGETDTVIGLFARCSKETFEKLNEIKGRTNRPYIFLVSDIEKAKKIVDERDYSMLLKIGEIVWPGPVTLIMHANSCYNYATAHDGTVAIRIPDNLKIRSFLQHFDALFSTSANRHKEETPHSMHDISKELLKFVDAQVIFNQKHASQKPSIILRVDGHTIVTLRGELEKEIINKLRSSGFTIA